jgi:outer membrane receptor for ferrienterochelin and colicins
LIPKALINVSFYNKFNGKTVSPYIDVNSQVEKETIQPYDLMQVSLGRKFWKDRFDVVIGAKNLLNVKTVDTAGGNGAAHSNGQNYILVGWGRTFFATVRFNISIKDHDNS